MQGVGSPSQLSLRAPASTCSISANREQSEVIVAGEGFLVPARSVVKGLDGHLLYDKRPVLHMLRTGRYPVEV
jgi:hypothetical protein